MATRERFYITVLVDGETYTPDKRLPLEGGIQRYNVTYDSDTSTLRIDSTDSEKGVLFYPGHMDSPNAKHYGFSTSIAVFVPTKENTCDVLVITRHENRDAFPTHLAFPAIYMQKNEDPLSVVLSQLTKSTGITVHVPESVSLHSIIESVPDDKTHNIMLVFQCGFNDPTNYIPEIGYDFVKKAQYMSLDIIQENLDKFTPGIAKMLGSSKCTHNSFVPK